MKKKFVSLLLALVMCLSLLPLPASAAGSNLPDWYFLFAIFKNVDADGKDRDNKAVHVKYSMSQDEVDIAQDNAKEFEEYMNSLGVMRAHVDVVEIDATATELQEYSGGSYIGPKQAAPLLRSKVGLDQYDHVFCLVSLDTLVTRWVGVTGSTFENGTGHSCVNFVNREFALKNYAPADNSWRPTLYVHEFLHFGERLSKRFSTGFNLHGVQAIYNTSYIDAWKGCYTDIILNQAKGTAETGTGVYPVTWQYPPHVLRTMTELTIPSGVTRLGHDAFLNYTNLTSVTIPSSVTFIDVSAFHGTGLTSVTIPASVTSIEEWTFANCSALTRISIPASVTSIGGAAFQKAGVTDVYYAGTEAQWKAIQMGEYNKALTNANIHYNHLMADVKTTDWFAKGVTWSVENGITAGTGAGKFSPNATCTQAQILTFLWRAYGSPEAAGKVSGSEYYAVPLQWARERGVISGSLNPNSPCTRADVVTYLWKLAGSPTAKAASFSDVPASASYAGAVSWAVEQGITSGTSAATFDPGSVCTRGQIVTFLRQALG